MANVIETLKQGKTLEANTCIKLPIEDKASIYGFVPYHRDEIDSCFGYEETVTCPPIGRANVIGDRIIFPLDGKFFRAPIFNSVSTPEEKYPVFLLYVPRFLNLPNKDKILGYKTAFSSEKPRLKGYHKYPDNIRVIDSIPFYMPLNGEFIFSSASKLRGIGNAFVIITRRLCKETGIVIYEVYNPKDVDIIEE
ncbi:MAG: hypothetical protein HDS97_03615 [Bacteroidales bacterium]|nr:hypothetical protein [Bacteroidales bacterium]